jgi:hypothetical protein
MASALLHRNRNHSIPTRRAFRPRLERLEDRATPTVLMAVGTGAGLEPRVYVYNADGSLRNSFDAYNANFTGGVAVAVGDVNGDGTPDIITGAGPGGGPHVKVFSGVDGTLLASFFAYNPSFTCGVWVAAGDVTGDGKADVVTGAGPGGGPNVKVFDLAADRVAASFFAYNPSFTGGVTVAAADVNADGRADVITGAGPGGGPHIKVFDGLALTQGGATQQAAIDEPLFSFFAPNASYFNGPFTGGEFVAAGDVNGDGHADIITGAGEPGQPLVTIYSGTDATMLNYFYPFARTNGHGTVGFAGGVRVAAADINGDGDADIITAPGVGSGGGGGVRRHDPEQFGRLRAAIRRSERRICRWRVIRATLWHHRTKLRRMDA